jgi:Ice-binding-like
LKLFVVFSLVLSSLAVGAFAQTITLGTADNFGILAASGITNVSTLTEITGDVGSSPTPSVTGLIPAQVSGTLFLNASPVTAQAQTDLALGYSQAVAATCGTDLSGQDLGGMTLAPGVYCFASSAALTGTLTLDGGGNANAQWIFQIGSTLTTAVNSIVNLASASKPGPKKNLNTCAVYWQVGSSATIGTGSIFVGKILALTSITLNGGTLRGGAFASNGAITMADRETVSASPCDATHGHHHHCPKDKK